MLLLNYVLPTWILLSRIIIRHFACSPIFTRSPAAPNPAPLADESLELAISGGLCRNSLRDMEWDGRWVSLYLS